jgi:hypothetical protein
MLSLPNRTLACSTAAGPFESVAILKDTVVGVSAKRLVSWSRKSGALLTDRTLPVEGSPTLSLTGNTLVIASPGGSKMSGDYTSVSTWRVGEDSFEQLGADDVVGRLRAVCFSPGETRIAWSSFQVDRNGHHRLVCDLDLRRVGRYPAFDFGPSEPFSERLARESEAPFAKTGGVALSEDAMAIAEKGIVQVIELPSLAIRWEAPLVGAEALRFGPDGTLYATTSKGLVAAYDGAGVQRWKSVGGRTSIPWLAAGGGIVTVAGGNSVIEAATGTVRAWLSTSLSAMAIAEGGREVATAPLDRASIVELWTLPP